MHFNHGEDSPDSPETRISESEIALQNTMMETNALLTAREHRLEAEWDEAEARHDLNSIQEIEGLIAETRGLRYNL